MPDDDVHGLAVDAVLLDVEADLEVESVDVRLDGGVGGRDRAQLEGLEGRRREREREGGGVRVRRVLAGGERRRKKGGGRK